jgi:hypothetical protein
MPVAIDQPLVGIEQRDGHAQGVQRLRQGWQCINGRSVRRGVSSPPPNIYPQLCVPEPLPERSLQLLRNGGDSGFLRGSR